jgi:hypothetical protein
MGDYRVYQMGLDSVWASLGYNPEPFGKPYRSDNPANGATNPSEERYNQARECCIPKSIGQWSHGDSYGTESGSDEQPLPPFQVALHGQPRFHRVSGWDAFRPKHEYIDCNSG